MPSINSTSRGVRLQHSPEEIAKYQKIKEEDMQAALKVCGKDIGAEAGSVVNCCYCLKRRAQRDSIEKPSKDRLSQLSISKNTAVNYLYCISDERKDDAGLGRGICELLLTEPT